MTYPARPGPRIAYDLDGTIAFVSGNSGARGAYQVVPQFLQYLNADSPRLAAIDDSYWGQRNITALENTAPVGSWLALKFPVAMRLRGIAFAGLWGGIPGSADSQWLRAVIETSEDSTNGGDGTWSEVLSYPGAATGDFTWNAPGGGSGALDPATMRGEILPDGSTRTIASIGSLAVQEEYRKQYGIEANQGWRAVAGAATRQVQWLRIRVTGVGTLLRSLILTDPPWGANLKLHLYGEPDTSADERRLQFVPTDSEVMKTSFDWGDVFAGQEATQQFRVKNLSTTETAVSVSVGTEPENPAIAQNPYTWLAVSLDESVWASSATLGDLAPGEVSDPVTLRLQVGSTLVGPWAPRIVAEAEEWV